MRSTTLNGDNYQSAWLWEQEIRMESVHEVRLVPTELVTGEKTLHTFMQQEWQQTNIQQREMQHDPADENNSVF